MPVVNCSYCQSEIIKSPSRVKRSKHFFCNLTCKGNWMSWQKGENTPRWKEEYTAICYTCKKPYKERPSRIARNKRTFCSKECFMKEKPNIAKESMKSRKKRIKVTCDYCGKDIFLRPYRLKQGYKNTFCNYSCRSAWRTENLSGENSWAWKGGWPEYYGPNWKKQRNKARKRDNYTCQKCHITEEKLGKQLDVHHIKPIREFGYIPNENDNYKPANNLENLICLCNKCHLTMDPR